uniref:type IX secretion system sortase PorU n=1 Tax=Roseivirga sp. TaxID=1964215 RepID=UPI004048CFA7
MSKTWSPLVFSSSNYTLNLALYGSILERPNDEFQRLGDIIQYTKNNALNGANNRNFILLADPSMRLSYPKNEIKITKINDKAANNEVDTLQALQRVIVEGAIVNAQQTVSSFNGELDFSLFDKRSSRQTLGTESAPFDYLERDSQLFNGKASITNGLFKIEFVVPKNINYQFGAGKMSMYAFKTDNIQDAMGAKIDFILGGTSKTTINDTQPPNIDAFINDTTNVSKIVVKRDAALLLKVFDESGINISESGIGQNLSATLNDSITYNLNGFYQAVKDDFRKGVVHFPMRGLPLGTNTLEIKAWDNFNNLATSSIEFEVTSENSTLITEINSYPNPLINNTTFSVSHNSAGEALEIVIEIINSKGEKVISLVSEIENSTNNQLIAWDGTDKYGSKLGKGIYIYNVFLRSINSGKTHVKRQKLIISY